MRVRVIYNDQEVVTVVPADQGITYTPHNVLVENAHKAAYMLEHIGVDVSVLLQYIEEQSDESPET